MLGRKNKANSDLATPRKSQVPGASAVLSGDLGQRWRLEAAGTWRATCIKCSFVSGKSFFIFEIYLFKKQNYRGGGETGNLPSAGSLHTWSPKLDWNQGHSKARRQELFPGRPHGYKGPRTWARRHAFPGHYLGPGSAVEQPGPQQVPMWNAGTVGSGFVH